jgi:hypothetical protein
MARKTSCIAGAWPRISGVSSTAAGVSDLPAALVHRAAHQLDRVVHVERLGQVLERAALERGYRAFEVRVRRHDDHRRRRQLRAQLLHEFEARKTGHADVAHDDLGSFLSHAVEGFERRAERAVRDALARERLLEHPADGAVVVDDPDRVHCDHLPGRAQRKDQREARVARFALELDDAVVLAHEALRERQAQPAAALRPLTSG